MTVECSYSAVPPSTDQTFYCWPSDSGPILPDFRAVIYTMLLPFRLRLLLDDSFETLSSASRLKGLPVRAPALGCFSALEMLRGEAGLPSMGVDIRSSHTAPQAGLARLLSVYKVRQRLLLGSDFLTKQLAVPPNVRRVAFIVGGPAKVQRAERLQQGLEQRQQQLRLSFFASESRREGGECCFPLAGCTVLSYCQRRPIGVVTSVTWSPLLQCRVAQGLVLFEFARHREVRQCRPSTSNTLIFGVALSSRSMKR